MNETILQAFYWEMYEGKYAKSNPKESNLWLLLKERAKEFAKLGITGIWIPPANKGSGGLRDVGYGTYDLWDLGEFNQKGSVRTKYGSKDELQRAIDILHKEGIKLYYDAVLNHRLGADETELVSLESGSQAKVWTKFTFPGRGDRYSSFKWDYRCFDGILVNDGKHEKKVYLFKDKKWDGSYDQDYLLGADIDYNNREVRAEIIKWAEWILNDIGFDGLRLDAVKNIDTDFIRTFISHLSRHREKEFMIFGEAWINSEDELISYIESVGHPNLKVLDFPLRSKFVDLMDSTLDLRWMGGFGLVNREGYGNRALTFVDNHDTDREDIGSYGTRSISRKKYQAYTYILTRETGIPILFWKDFYVYSMEAKLTILLEVRKRYAYGKGYESESNDNNTYSYTRAGDDDDEESGLVMMITQANNGEVITKRINSRKPNTTFIDYTGNVKGTIITDKDGYGNFNVRANDAEGYSIWVPIRD